VLSAAQALGPRQSRYGGRRRKKQSGGQGTAQSNSAWPALYDTAPSGTITFWRKEKMT